MNKDVFISFHFEKWTFHISPDLKIVSLKKLCKLLTLFIALWIYKVLNCPLMGQN